MKSNKLLSLSYKEQETWLYKNLDKFYEKAYEGELIGYIYFIDAEYEIEDYIYDPGGYETGSIIKPFMTDMTAIREEEINSGSAITDQEKECLKKAVTKIVIEDNERQLTAGTTFSVYPFNCEDGEVFVLFSGQTEGPGDVSWDFCSIFDSENAALKSVSQNLDENEYFFPI